MIQLNIRQYNEALLRQDEAANFNRPYQQCAISVMDTIADPGISFDEKGICNYYYEYLQKAKWSVPEKEAAEIKLAEIIKQIKDAGAGKEARAAVAGLSRGL